LEFRRVLFRSPHLRTQLRRTRRKRKRSRHLPILQPNTIPQRTQEPKTGWKNRAGNKNRMVTRPRFNDEPTPATTRSPPRRDLAPPGIAVSLWHFFPNRYHWEVIMAGKRNKPLTVTEAAEKGDQLAEMRAMRLVVARRIEDETNGAALA